MASPPQLWTLVVSNVFVFVLGGSLTLLSYKARKRLDKENLDYTVLGFGLVTASTVVEVAYAPAIVGVYEVTDSALLTLYTVESLCIGVGLACIWYSVRRY